MNLRINKSGNAMIEFTLVGIPLIFVLLATFELARGMWLYATVAHAVRAGARYAAVHGKDCSTLPNQCAVTVADVAGVIRDAGVGLDPMDLRLAMIATSPNTVPVVTLKPLSMLLVDASVFPSGTASVAGNDVFISGVFYFRTALTALFPPPITPPPPPAPMGGGSDAGVIPLAATSRERIEF